MEYNKNISPKILKHFYHLKDPKTKTLSNLYGDMKTLSQPLKNPESYYILDDSGEPMTKKKMKNLSINYKIESWFYKRLDVLYDQIHKKLDFLFTDLLKLKDLAAYLDLELSQWKEQILNVVAEFKSRKRSKENQMLKFRFITKDFQGVLLLNKLCQICPLYKNNYQYTLKCKDETQKNQILQMLDSYVINRKDAQYQVIVN